MTQLPQAPSSADTSRIDPPEARSVQHISSGFNTLSRCRYGWMLYHTADQYIGGSLHKYGEFSEGEVGMFRQLLRPGDVVVEAGANFGAHTVAMAQMVGPEGAIYAFEPQRLIYQILTANVAINSLNNVTTLHAGLGAEMGSIRVPTLDPTRGQNFGGFSISGHPAGEEVPVATVDSMGLDQCGMIKVDVEGMEYQVLEGARATIARLKPALYVENDRAENSSRLIAQIQAMGYRLWWHAPPLYNPENFRRDAENIFGKMVSINMLCLPREIDVTINLPEVRSPDDDWRRAFAEMGGQK